MTKSVANKFSISIPGELTASVKQYQKEYGVCRSEVFTKGLEKLREEELARAYQNHAEEWQTNPDKDFWDTAALTDGLDSD